MWIRHAVALVALLGVVVLRACGGVSHRGCRFTAELGCWPTEARHDRVQRRRVSASAAANSTAFTSGAGRFRRRNFIALSRFFEPTITKAASTDAPAGPVLEKLYMYVAQARFILNRAPGSFNLSRYVSLPFLEKIDPAIKHKLIAATDISPLTDPQGTGNDNPDRKWCTGRNPLICIESTYKLEGKIPLGMMLVNKLRDSARKFPTISIFRARCRRR